MKMKSHVAPQILCPHMDLYFVTKYRNLRSHCNRFKAPAGDLKQDRPNKT